MTFNGTRLLLYGHAARGAARTQTSKAEAGRVIGNFAYADRRQDPCIQGPAGH